jgi:glyoxylase-like metal-dependent hydrolase (beta-lactamase superfamily II)
MRRFVFAACSLILLVAINGSTAFGQPTTEYEVYVIEYADAGVAPMGHFLRGADTALTVDGSYMIWLLKGPDGQNILVDAGFRRDAPGRTVPESYVSPDQAVARLGVLPEDVTDIILTHLHWDHADGIPLFPNAHIWVQKAELEYYASEAWQDGGNAAGVQPRNVPELVQLNTEGRVTLIDGDDQEIFDGIRVYTGPKHTFASQYVGVNTSGGTVIVASDCLWFYANLELKLEKTYTFDPQADFEAFDRMRQLASHPDWILPGHDRQVFDRFPNPSPGVARIR